MAKSAKLPAALPPQQFSCAKLISRLPGMTNSGLEFPLSPPLTRGQIAGMLDSRAFGARMTGLSLGLDSRLCNGGNDGSCGGGCVLATGCEQGDAKNQAQEGYCRLPIADCRLPIADCRLPIADCRLPIADCRLPIADCRLPILRQRRLRSSYSGWFVSCVFPLCYANGFCHRQRSLYIKKPECQVFL